jgi:D-lactate dehydrogenase
MNILVYSTRNFEKHYLIKANKSKHSITFIKESLSPETVDKAKGYDVISLTPSDDASELTIEKLKEYGINYISLRCTGYDNVNISLASISGIQVANVPAYSPYAIAEFATSLLLAINRKLIISNERINQYNFNIDKLTGFDLNNKTIGIIGTGKIGAVMTKIMNGFGCNILGYDVNINQHLIDNFNMEYVSIKELCEKSDVISLHVPLNQSTKHLIDEKLLNKMKSNIIIINTARGAVINTKDVIKALENNQIAALGMDVYENEDGVFFKDLSDNIPNDEILKKLISMPNVLLCSHHAFLTEEALTNIAETTFYNIDCWSKNKETENQLTI